MLDFTELFFYVYDFCKFFLKWWEKQLLNNTRITKRKRLTRMHLAEIATIIIGFHGSNMKCFKSYYLYLLRNHRKDFNLVSYDRFITLMKRAFPVVLALFEALKADATAINFADSTPYEVCRYCRSNRHKVFAALADRSRNSMGWFFGMKLHFIFNEHGEIVRLAITKASTDDRKGLKLMINGIFGKIYADRGYLGKQFFKDLFAKGIQVITRIRKNMKNKLLHVADKICLKKRMIIESIFSSIKSCGTFVHSRHRNIVNALCHILSALIFYQLRENKPSFLEKARLKAS